MKLPNLLHIFRQPKYIILSIFISLIFILFLIIKFLVPNGNTVLITKNGAEIYKINLQKIESPYTLDLDDEYNVSLLLEQDGVSFIHSDCPDKICIKTGKISKPYQTAVCLPAKVCVKIINQKSSVDAVTW